METDGGDRCKENRDAGVWEREERKACVELIDGRSRKEEILEFFFVGERRKRLIGV